MKLSVVTPVYNEKGNLERLHKELTEVLRVTGKDYEIIAVNDGSRDGSLEVLRTLAQKDPHFKVINFIANHGQTAALLAGIDHASGDIIIMIDSDLENDPKDIPRLLEKIDEGYDVVSGWRKERWGDKKFRRKLPSVLANKLISQITRVPLHDYGCILKAYKRDVIVGVRLYGEMHRFIPAYASWRGAKVTEIPVDHRPRTYGKTNYGISRTFRVLLDLLVLKFLTKYMNRPIHFFGGLGFVSLALGCVAAGAAIIMKIIGYRTFVGTPLPIFSALFIIVGVQLVVMGILAEILMRTYYESQDKKPYTIKEKINF
jgi:dolichol-phosphate mannosyltransferase